MSLLALDVDASLSGGNDGGLEGGLERGTGGGLELEGLGGALLLPWKDLARVLTLGAGTGGGAAPSVFGLDPGFERGGSSGPGADIEDFWGFQ